MKENQLGSYQKCLLIKTYEWNKKSFTRWFNQKKKGMAWYIKNRCVRVADKHKIIFVMA